MSSVIEATSPIEACCSCKEICYQFAATTTSSCCNCAFGLLLQHPQFSKFLTSLKMNNAVVRIIAFCISQTILVRGFRSLVRPMATAVKTKLSMGTDAFSMPDQQARFAKAKAEGMVLICLFLNSVPFLPPYSVLIIFPTLFLSSFVFFPMVSFYSYLLSFLVAATTLIAATFLQLI